MEVKTVKSFLRMCLELSYVNRDALRDIGKITESEYMALGEIRAAIQNELGELPELLEKFNLKYEAHK